MVPEVALIAVEVEVVPPVQRLLPLRLGVPQVGVGIEVEIVPPSAPRALLPPLRSAPPRSQVDKVWAHPRRIPSTDGNEQASP